MTTERERLEEIGKTLRSAMTALRDVDWTRESEAITQAQLELDETTTKYVEGNASKVEVKQAYKAFVNAHRGGLFG